MALFFVASLSNSEAILARAKELTAQQPTNLHEVQADKFFIVFEGTSVELSQALGFADSSTGTGIVLAVTAYHGLAPKSVWEWVAQKAGA